MIQANEPPTGPWKDGANSIMLEKLDIIIEEQQILQDLLEDVFEKLTDLDVTTRAGYSTYD
mgnify:CR=1 FL=1